VGQTSGLRPRFNPNATSAIKGAILSEPWFAKDKEEGKTALRLSGRKPFLPKPFAGTEGRVIGRKGNAVTATNAGTKNLDFIIS
jgi:hypothetical protein